MNFLKRFWYNVKSSFYDPAFYSQLGNKRFSRAILVLTGVLFFNMILVCIYLGVMAGAFLKTFSDTLFVDKYYPEGLELTAKDNRFTSNVEEPFMIPMPQDSDHADGPEIKNIVTIDTSEALTLDQIRSYDSAVVVTKDGVVVKKNGGEQTLTLKEAKLGDFVINEVNVASWTAKAISVAKKALLPLLALLLVLGTAFSLAWYMFTSLIAGLAVKIIAAIKKIEMPYGTAYRVGLFASIPVIILNMLLNPFFDIPGLIDIALFVLVVALNMIKTEPASAPVATTTETV